jgi:hypothetical protein
MLLAIDDTTLGHAFDLLGRGWPNRSRRFWELGLERLRAIGANAAANVPTGYLLMAEKQPAGVVLTPATARVGARGEAQTIINISSWYIDPPHRWLAPVMLRGILRGSPAVFTDLTPTERVQQMLPPLGFQALNDGETIVVLPYAAMQRAARAAVVELSEVPEPAIAASTWKLLRDHARLGCLAAALADGSSWQPLLFKGRKIRNLPAAQLIYCESNSCLHGNLAAVARYLLRHGTLLLAMDIPLGGVAPGIERRHRGRRFARGGAFKDRTDYAGSELCLFDY